VREKEREGGGEGGKVGEGEGKGEWDCSTVPSFIKLLPTNCLSSSTCFPLFSVCFSTGMPAMETFNYVII
jgi:hypothetical protein